MRDASDSHEVVTLSPRTQEEVVVHDDLGPDKDTFGEVLAHNVGLNVVQTMVSTLGEALSQVPRKRYPGQRRVERRAVREAAARRPEQAAARALRELSSKLEASEARIRALEEVLERPGASSDGLTD